LGHEGLSLLQVSEETIVQGLLGGDVDCGLDVSCGELLGRSAVNDDHAREPLALGFSLVPQSQ